ncbi:hypothetical protein ACOSQ3_004298 [Xanthoceras sorbifolium]
MQAPVKGKENVGVSNSTVAASSDYEKVVDTHSNFVTHTLRSYIDFDLGLDSSDGPLLADTCSHLANTGPHGVINEVDFTLKSAPKPQSVVSGLVKSHSTPCKVAQAMSSHWKRLARKAKQPSLALRVEPKRAQIPILTILFPFLMLLNAVYLHL